MPCRFPTTPRLPSLSLKSHTLEFSATQDWRGQIFLEPLTGEFLEWWNSLQSVSPRLLPSDLHEGAGCATSSACACGAPVLGIDEVDCGAPLASICKKLLKDIRSRAKSSLTQDRYMLICIARVKGVGDRIPELEKLRSSNCGT